RLFNLLGCRCPDVFRHSIGSLSRMRARLFAPEFRKWWTLAAVAVGLFMIMLDNTVVVVALPAIQHDLGISVSELEWVFNAYALTFGVLLLTGGKLADLLGRRLIFIAGLVIFTASSLACGLANRADRGEQEGVELSRDPRVVRRRRSVPGRVRAARAAPADSDARPDTVQEPHVRGREHRDAPRRAGDVRHVLLRLALPAEHPALL